MNESRHSAFDHKTFLVSSREAADHPQRRTHQDEAEFVISNFWKQGVLEYQIPKAIKKEGPKSRQGPRSVSEELFVQLNQYPQILRRQCCLLLTT